MDGRSRGNLITATAIYVLGLLLILVSGCVREEFSLQMVQVFPTVVAAYTQRGDIGISEGLAIALSVGKIESDREYGVTVRSPESSILWETLATVVKDTQVPYLGVVDFVLAPGFPLPDGEWRVELSHTDGRVLHSGFTMSHNAPHTEVLNRADLVIPGFFWETQENGDLSLRLSLLSENSGYDSAKEIWHVQLLDSTGMLIASMESSLGLLDTSGLSQDPANQRIAMAVCFRYDESAGCLLIGRTIFD